MKIFTSVTFLALIAISISAIMDYSGYAMFSALPLIFIMAISWYALKATRQEIGMTLGTPCGYQLALLQCLIPIGGLTILAFAFSAVDLSSFEGDKVLKNLLLVGFSTIIMAIITEEGFFRGTLWAAMAREGKSERTIILRTSVIFTVWHLSFATLTGEFDLPIWQVLIYLGNVFLLGFAWACLRNLSQSLIVPSVAHGVWNGFVYVLFGLATKPGALGIADHHIFGPETGILGLFFNGLVGYYLWHLVQKEA